MKERIIKKIRNGEVLDIRESLVLYSEFSLTELMMEADAIRRSFHPGNVVTYIIDRNINITNVCFSFCEFCNFCVAEGSSNAYITTIDQYIQKIRELYDAGGNQVLLQGGMHPKLGLSFYTELFTELKQHFPTLYLHALSPSEIIFLAKKEKLSVEMVLRYLKEAGMDSLPGGGAEILVDDVRKNLSPLKATAQEWLDVMRTAHQLFIPTTATMMFGHIETVEQRLLHILSIQSLQHERPEGSPGFVSFIPWTFQSGYTRLAKKENKSFHTGTHEYLKVLAVSRLLLQNIPHVQASWLTAGFHAAMLALHGGADDLGSIMLEENVVASTGLHRRMQVTEIEQLIMQSGFTPKRRNQQFRWVG